MPALDVLCVGEALWDLQAPAGVPFERAASLGFAPGGAAVNVALALAKLGLRAGLATVVGDDALGQALAARLEAAGVDTALVQRAPQRTGLVFLEATAAGRRAVSYRHADEPQPDLPANPRIRALFLTGLLPSPDQHERWCLGAIAARRAGAIVVIDLNTRPRVWKGRADEASAASALLHAVDVVKCSRDDLAVLHLEAHELRRRMRPEATLVVTDGALPACAEGPYGRFELAPGELAARDTIGAGDAFSTGLLAELCANTPKLASLDFWKRAVQRGHALARAHLVARNRARRSNA